MTDPDLAPDLHTIACACDDGGVGASEACVPQSWSDLSGQTEYRSGYSWTGCGEERVWWAEFGVWTTRGDGQQQNPDVNVSATSPAFATANQLQL